MPSDLEGLLEVPGLGAYSAAAILSFGYNTPIAILDANVERILVRVFGNELPPRPSKAVLNEVAQRLLPPDDHRDYNYGLLDLGRLVCRYANPKCDMCPLNTICDSWTNAQPRQDRMRIKGVYLGIPRANLRLPGEKVGLASSDSQN